MVRVVSGAKDRKGSRELGLKPKGLGGAHWKPFPVGTGWILVNPTLSHTVAAWWWFMKRPRDKRGAIVMSW